ncbi:MAG: D-alanyl-D-alanine dipeptidase [Alphaproteobacteria bacterium]|nr:D-alanyl-D-alanine dipeptidase [Alphaproteobacteria bacterium]
MTHTQADTYKDLSDSASLSHSSLVEITEASHNILLELRYATKNNITGARIYHDDRCFIHKDADVLLRKSIILAQEQNLKIKIFDAYRPRSVQEALWAHCPDPNYVMPPEKGSHHTRGVAIDLTLIDASGKELDMGTDFDDLSPRAHHGASTHAPQVAANRYMLLGIMMSAGWDFFQNEWWHYQVFKARDYPLI